jgi:hypothetical protein
MSWSHLDAMSDPPSSSFMMGSERPLPLAGTVTLRNHLRARLCSRRCNTATPPITGPNTLVLWERLRSPLLWVAAAIAADRRWSPGSAWGAPPWIGSMGARTHSANGPSGGATPALAPLRWHHVCSTIFLSLSVCVLWSVKGSNEMETRVALRVRSDVGFVRSNERARPFNHDGWLTRYGPRSRPRWARQILAQAFVAIGIINVPWTRPL